jgi:ribosomal protein S27AE
MEICCKCGADFDLFEARPRGPRRVCKECLPSELAIQEEIGRFGLVALAKRYVPDATLCVAGLGRWRSLSDTVSGLAGRAAAIALTGGVGGMLTRNFKPGFAGLVGVTKTELVVVELKTLGNPTDTFNYNDLSDLNLPAHYSQNRNVSLAKVKRYPLGVATKAACETAEGVSVLSITDRASLEPDFPVSIDFPDSYYSGNAAAASLMAQYIGAPAAIEQQLDYTVLANTEVRESSSVKLKTRPCRGCGREIVMSAVRDHCPHCGYTAPAQLWGCLIVAVIAVGLCFLTGVAVLTDYTPGVGWLSFWGIVAVFCVQWLIRKAIGNARSRRDGPKGPAKT